LHIEVALSLGLDRNRIAVSLYLAASDASIATEPAGSSVNCSSLTGVTAAFRQRRGGH